MKRILSLTLALAMIICTMTAAPLFAKADTDMLFAFSEMNGYNKMNTLKTIAPTTTLAVGDSVTTSNRIRYYTSLSSGTDKLFGLAGPQKASDDKVFCDTAGDLKTNNLRVDRSNAANGGISTDTNAYKYMTYVFDFYFPNETSNVGIRNGHINSNSNYYFAAFLLASSSASGYSQMDKKPVARQAYYNNVGTKKWHRAKVTFPIDGVTEAPVILYLDGEEVSRSTANLALTNASGNSLYGLATAPADLFFKIDGAENGTYIDNLKMYVGDGNVSDDIKPIPEFAGSDIKYQQNIVKIPERSSVSDIQKVLITEDISFCGVYDSTLTTQKTDMASPINGDILVLGSTNGLYTYTPIETYQSGEVQQYTPYQSVTGEFVSGQTTNIVGTAIENGMSFTSPLSSGLSSRLDTDFPESIDLSALGDEYTLSFKIKHTHLGTKVPNNYVSQLFLKFDTGVFGTSYYQLFSNGNGFCVPSSGTGSLTKNAINGTSAACSSAKMQIAGMEFDKEYLFQIYVNEKTNQLIYMINDMVLVDASSKETLVTTKLKGAASLDGFGIQMRGGDGTDPYIQLDMWDFKAIPGKGYVQINDADFDLANGELLFNRINLMPSSVTALPPLTIIVAGYDANGRLVGTVSKETAIAKGGVKDKLTLEDEDKAALAGATKVKAFFLNDMLDLTPYTTPAEAQITQN